VIFPPHCYICADLPAYNPIRHFISIPNLGPSPLLLRGSPLVPPLVHSILDPSPFRIRAPDLDRIIIDDTPTIRSSRPQGFLRNEGLLSVSPFPLFICSWLLPTSLQYSSGRILSTCGCDPAPDSKPFPPALFSIAVSFLGAYSTMPPGASYLPGHCPGFPSALSLVCLGGLSCLSSIHSST
jgi:hypothetical protein